MSAISGASSVLQILSNGLTGGQPFSSASLSSGSASELASLGTAEIALQQSQDLFVPSSSDLSGLGSTQLASSLDPASLTQSSLNLQSGYDSYAQANPSVVGLQPGSLLNVLG